MPLNVTVYSYSMVNANVFSAVSLDPMSIARRVSGLNGSVGSAVLTHGLVVAVTDAGSWSDSVGIYCPFSMMVEG